LNTNEANPLLQEADLPPLSSIRAEHVVPAIKQILAHNRQQIEQLAVPSSGANWENVAEPLAELEALLDQAWSPVAHLHGVHNSEALRRAYDEALPLLTEYATEMGQHSDLYQAWLSLRESDAYQHQPQPKKKAVDNALRDFRLSGVALTGPDKQRFAQLQQDLASLGARFSNNVLDATQGWYQHLADDHRLGGVPKAVLATLAQAAAARDLEGYVITLDIPSYLPVMQYASDRELRETLYQAYSTRASEQGPNAGRWDNSEIMQEILAARHELATLLGFANYAEYSLASKMAESTAQVVDFLEDLAAKTRPFAQRELAELQVFALDKDGLATLEAWDVAYYSEQLRQSRYAISQQDVRPYFPVERVLRGLFSVVGRLFAVDFEQVTDFDSYHPDVSFYRVMRAGEHVASFYLDLYARSDKRGGAWMADCRNRRLDAEHTLHLPVAFLVCNFTPPGAAQPALLTHDEVTTLFHEFGHGLHHMLTRVDVAAVAGINGVAWDAVELPSQFLENWCWQEEALGLISGHYRTGESLPEALLKKMLAARHFQAGMQMMRQLEFALFDFRLHMEYQPSAPVPVLQVLNAVRAQVSVVSAPEYNRFAHSFSHIFAGGYAAGYYSYKWAELLSADAFSRFEEEGIFNPHTGQAFLQGILEAGGTQDAADLFRVFRGRDPDSAALLRHSGLIAQAQ
jgi:oligopeptidase A